MNDAIVQLVLAAREASYHLKRESWGVEALSAANRLDEILDQFCPACSSPERLPAPQDMAEPYPGALENVRTCAGCSCLYGTCDEQTSFGLVQSAWSKNRVPYGKAIPFDLMTVDSSGNKHRRHGWMDPVTRLITQVG